MGRREKFVKCLPVPTPHLPTPASLRSYLNLHGAFFNAFGQDDLQQSPLQLGRDIDRRQSAVKA